MENINETQQNYTVGADISNTSDMTSNGPSPVTNMLLNDGVASEYDMPQPGEMSRDDYAYSRGRNREFYPDPTYHQAKRGYYQNPNYVPREKPAEKTVPYYIPRHSRRHETIGLIMRICDLAGFELAERVVLRDKETGEVLR